MMDFWTLLGTTGKTKFGKKFQGKGFELCILGADYATLSNVFSRGTIVMSVCLPVNIVFVDQQITFLYSNITKSFINSI